MPGPHQLQLSVAAKSIITSQQGKNKGERIMEVSRNLSGQVRSNLMEVLVADTDFESISMKKKVDVSCQLMFLVCA